jgi:hypothetical protein
MLNAVEPPVMLNIGLVEEHIKEWWRILVYYSRGVDSKLF